MDLAYAAGEMNLTPNTQCLCAADYDLILLLQSTAIISVAIGPSGSNDIYLFHLDEFLSNAANHSPEVATMLNEHAQDDRTSELANMVKQLQLITAHTFYLGLARMSIISYC